jgi:plasmid stabilization system protein ParE
VATVVYSELSLRHLERAFNFLREKDPRATAASAVAIRSAIENLSRHPLIGQRIDGEIRELVISYGASGYIALYRFVVVLDEVRVLAIRHQRELGYRP